MSKAKDVLAVAAYLCVAVSMTVALWWGAIANFDDRIDGDHGRLLISVLCFVNAVGYTVALLLVALVSIVLVWCVVTPDDPAP